MRELTVPDLGPAIAQMRAPADDAVAALVSSKRLRLQALTSTIATLEAELRVIECFAKIRAEWQTLPCRNKLRHVLGSGVAFAPTELAVLLGHKVNTIRSSLMRMRSRGEVKRQGHGRWSGVAIRAVVV